MNVVLLPGLDGTGALFRPFVERAPPRYTTESVGYPADVPHGYGELQGMVEARLPSSGPYVIVAESFSSPLGVMLTRSVGHRPRALVLVGGFLRRPVAPIWGLLPLTPLIRIRPPSWLLRRYALGNAADDLIPLVRAALGRVSARVLAGRVREILRVDCRQVLRELSTPVLYLGGSRDRLIGERCRRDVVECRPDAHVVVLDAPHFVLQCAPQAAWEAIERFLSNDATVRMES